MATDPIIQGIHKVREAYAERFGNDLQAIVRDARAKQGGSGRKLVRLAPKPASAKPRGDAAA